MPQSEQILTLIKATIRQEADALDDIIQHIDQAYVQAIALIQACTGKVVLTGVGKSGLVARKIAATMSSTGTQAIFLHPAEAMHGDLGMVSSDDVIIALGKSGESEELTAILPILKRMGNQVIAMTANRNSTLAKLADVILYCGVTREACPHDLVPTASTTVAMAIGDALAITLMKLKGFKEDDFAIFHPGGRLGKRLLLRVLDLMIPLEQVPVLHPDSATIEEVIVALSRYGLGIVLFSRDGHTMAGMLTDGDIRRLLDRHKSRIFEVQVAEVLNPNPIAVQHQVMAVEALRQMEDRDRPLNLLPVLEGDRLAGLIRLHELLRVA